MKYQDGNDAEEDEGKNENIIKEENNFKIIIKIIEAKELIGKNSNSNLNPYVIIPQEQNGVIDLPKKFNKTKKLDKTLNPIWNESFIIEFNPKKCTKLKIEVYDYAPVGKDDFIGFSFIPLDKVLSYDDYEFDIYDEWIPIIFEKINKKTKQNEKTQKGSIHIKMRYLGLINNTKENDDEENNNKDDFEFIEVLPPTMIESFINHKYGESLEKYSSIIITEPNIKVKILWENPKKIKLEFDAAIAAFDEKMNPLDCAYYFKLEILDGYIIHLGDKVKKNRQKIRINFEKLPNNVNYLAVILFSGNENSLDKAESISLKLSIKKDKIGKFVLNKLNNKKCFCLLLGIFQKDRLLNNWYFTTLAEPIRGRTFSVSKGNVFRLLCKYSLNKEFQSLIYDYTKESHPFHGEDVYILENKYELEPGLIYIGFGWVGFSTNNIDLSPYIYAFDDKYNLIDDLNISKDKAQNGNLLIYSEEEQSKIPEAKTDDFLLSIDFKKLDNKISTIIMFIRTSENGDFIKISDVFIRLFDKQGPFGIHRIHEFSKDRDNSIVIAVFKKVKDIWYFIPVNWPFYTGGDEIKDELKDILDVIQDHPIKIN